MKPPRILIVPGSARTGSLNLQLANAVATVLRGRDAQVTLTDLRALALPIYDGDLEAKEGVPPGAKTLVDQFAAHDAVVVVSPEYNAFPPPLLMNAIDWATRLPEHKAAMGGKPCALMAASPGALGGIRSLLSLRQFLSINPGLLVIGPQFGLGLATKAFAADGSLADEKQRGMLDGVLSALLDTSRRLLND
jgi:chromate reductase, NAD(P)H dehydrogenase (quinone)